MKRRYFDTDINLLKNVFVFYVCGLILGLSSGINIKIKDGMNPVLHISDSGFLLKLSLLSLPILLIQILIYLNKRGLIPLIYLFEGFGFSYCIGAIHHGLFVGGWIPTILFLFAKIAVLPLLILYGTNAHPPKIIYLAMIFIVVVILETGVILPIVNAVYIK